MTAIQLRTDFAATPTPLRQPWQHVVGSGHATLALRADWQAQLVQAHRDLGFRHVRFHGILDDDMGTLVMQSDQLLYSFFNTDRIFDFLLSIGMKPLVELSFMPRTLSSGGNIVFHYQGNITPPKDYSQWGELVRRIAQHWVDRYGIDEVATWPFECWNEPNLPAFWTGTQNDYFKLYKSTALALKSVDPRLEIGGPVTSENAWLDDFLAWCGKEGLPVDFLSTHYYPTDALGATNTDTVSQLAGAPRGVMRERALEARAAAAGRPLYYTEWNITSNPRDSMHDSSFCAALAARIVMSVDDVVDAYSWWTFTDIFEENYLPSVPYHGGFGLVNLYGVPKPVYRALQMLRELGDERFALEVDHPTVVAWAGRPQAMADAEASVVLVNQAMPRHPIDTEAVRLHVAPPAGRRAHRVEVARIDADHANPERAWHEIGSPEYPSPAQVALLFDASTLRYEPVQFEAVDGGIELALDLAPQSAQHVRVTWEATA